MPVVRDGGSSDSSVDRFSDLLNDQRILAPEQLLGVSAPHSRLAAGLSLQLASQYVNMCAKSGTSALTLLSSSARGSDSAVVGFVTTATRGGSVSTLAQLCNAPNAEFMGVIAGITGQSKSVVDPASVLYSANALNPS